MRSTKTLFKELYRLISDYKLKVIASMAVIIISTLCITYAPKVAGQAVNYFLDGLSETDYSMVYDRLNLLFVLYTLGYALKLVSSRIMIKTAEKITYRLRLKLYDGLTNADLAKIYPTSSGNIMARVNNDLMNVRNFIMFYFSEYFASFITIFFTIILIISVDIRLGLVYLTILPLFAIMIYYFDYKSKDDFKHHQIELGSLIGFIGDSISNHAAIQAFESQDYAETNFRKINEKVDKYYRKSRLSTGVIFPFIQLFINLGNIGAYLYGAYLLINHEILLGSLLTIILYGQILSKPIIKVSKILTSKETTLASLDRVVEIIQTPFRDFDEGRLIDSSFKDVIEFKGLCYGDIRDFNLKVDIGEVVRLKEDHSSLMEMLLRLYRPESGEILLDGVNINDYNLKSYRAIFGYVTSSKWIFEGTIEENIGYGLEDYTLEDVKRVCEMIGFDRIVETLPDSYSTLVSDEKNTISTSEKEMICLARALIRNPEIVILEDVNVDLSIFEGKNVFIIN